jgi:hypothetical protein
MAPDAQLLGRAAEWKLTIRWTEQLRSSVARGYKQRNGCCCQQQQQSFFYSSSTTFLKFFVSGAQLSYFHRNEFFLKYFNIFGFLFFI